MPTVFYILAGALAAGALAGLRRRPVIRPSWLLVGLLYLAWAALLARRIGPLDRFGLFALVMYLNLVWGITAAAATLARLVRSRGLPLAQRMRIHAGSLAMLAVVVLVAGPIGRVLVRRHLDGAPTVMDADGCVRQSTPVTCGPASLASVFRRLGLPGDEAPLAAEVGTSLMGSSAPQLAAVVRRRGLVWTAISDPLNAPSSLARLPGVAVVHLPGIGVSHLVALLETRNGLVHLADPAFGGRWVSPDELEAMRWGAWYSIRKKET